MYFELGGVYIFLIIQLSKAVLFTVECLKIQHDKRFHVRYPFISIGHMDEMDSLYLCSLITYFIRFLRKGI